MKYDLKKFDSAVRYYESALRKIKGKTLFVVIDMGNEDAFFSLAPLSRAAHNLKIDVSANVVTEHSQGLDALMDFWTACEDLERGVKNPKTRALAEFIKILDRKTKGEFKSVRKKPDAFMYAAEKEFLLGDQALKYQRAWHKKYRWNDLLKTAKIVWTQVYDLKKHEKVGIGFDLVNRAQDMQYPLEDYLDHYSIAWTMMLACPGTVTGMKSASVRKTMLEKGERTSELSATLLGCELEKDINEPVFRAYRKLSKELRLDRFKTNDAAFLVKGEGFPGKHIFGEYIGYPTPNRKSRWESPGGMIYQFPWYPQTKIDSRPPRTRLGFTDTVPLDIYIDSCKIDWLRMKKIDDKLIALANKSEKIIVSSDKTNLEVGLVGKSGKRRKPMNSDVDTRTLLDLESLKEGIEAGNMANIPGGEMFLTPEYVKGTFSGDVVINIDKSYPLSSKEPLVVRCDGNSYKILAGPKKIVAKLEEKKREAMKMLERQEKNKSIPQSVIDLKRNNYSNIGEFAINTNPKARLCNYLIVNEKIAGMMHIALGSGFEHDRASIYHYDIVINAKEQKVDIYGVTKSGQKLWMMRKGKLVFGW